LRVFEARAGIQEKICWFFGSNENYKICCSDGPVDDFVTYAELIELPISQWGKTFLVLVLKLKFIFPIIFFGILVK